MPPAPPHPLLLATAPTDRAAVLTYVGLNVRQFRRIFAIRRTGSGDCTGGWGGSPARRPFTPTQEPPEALERRTVGRDRLLTTLAERLASAAGSQSRPHTLLVGPPARARHT